MEGKLHIHALERLTRSHALGDVRAQAGVRDFSAWSEPTTRSYESPKPEDYKTKITLTGNDTTSARQSDKAGRASFGNLSVGEYKISVPLIPNYKTRYWSDGVRSCYDTSVTVGASQAVTIWYEPQPKVTVKLTSPAFKKPLSSVPLLANFRLQYLGAKGPEPARPPQFRPPKTAYFFYGCATIQRGHGANPNCVAARQICTETDVA